MLKYIINVSPINDVVHAPERAWPRGHLGLTRDLKRCAQSSGRVEPRRRQGTI
jgi:hypothetical protein